MTAKQLTGNTAPDASRYACVTDGSGTLAVLGTAPRSGTKLFGTHAPDGSEYITLTDGAGTLK